MKRFLAISAVLAWLAGTQAGPIFPGIDGHDFSFDGHNEDGTMEYKANGTAPDTLVFSRNADDAEAVSYRPNWPAPPSYPVWHETLGLPTFGGDFTLAVQFDDSDAPLSGLDVSFTGTGMNPVGVADLEIYGTLVLGPDPNDTISGLLWAVDLAEVSLYGQANANKAYVVEGVGTILPSLIADRNGLVGDVGAVRGHLDFFDRPPGWIPGHDHYTPDTDESYEIRAAYSGETGWVPEPASLFVVGLGALLFRRGR